MIHPSSILLLHWKQSTAVSPSLSTTQVCLCSSQTNACLYCQILNQIPYYLTASFDPGFAYKGDAFGADEADKTISVNYRGTRAVCEAVQPLLTHNARIVNVSSRSGLLKILQSDSVRQKADSATSLQTVDELAEEFVASIKADK